MNSGIYKIWFNGSDNFYIGSSIMLTKRKLSHLRCLRNGSHGNPILQYTYNKYGEDNFNFKILIFTLPEITKKVEQWYLDYYKPEYNIKTLAAGGTVGKFTEKQILEIFNKALTTSAKKIAEEYNCNKTTIQGILYRNKHDGINLPEDLKVKILNIKKTFKNNRSHNALVTDQVAGEIKFLLGTGVINTKLASYYGISRNIITAIKYNETYKSVIPIEVDNIPKNLYIKERKGKDISMINKNGNIINYKSLKDCIDINNFPSISVRRSIKNNTYYKGYKFQYI